MLNHYLFVWFKLFSCICLSVLTLISCKPVSENPEHLGLVYCSQDSPSSLNPQLSTSSAVVEATSLQIYNQLLAISDDGESLEPELATHWQQNDAGTLYTLHLRPHVAFQQTRYFTPTRFFNAQDVVFSFNRIIDKNHPYHPIGNSDYTFFNSVGFPLLVKSVQALDESTVQFELFAPDSTFLINLATDFSVILSQEYAQQLLQQGHPELIDQQPIGTGPYAFYQYKAARYLKFKRHPHYWRGLPSLSDLVYDITPNSSMRLAKLLTGECDVMAFPLASDVSLIRSKPQLKMQYRTGFNLGYWAFNTTKAPFDNVKVRQALAMAINLEPMMKAVYYGSASPATGLLPPASWAYDSLQNSAVYAPQKAKKMLAEAGYPNGFELEILLMPIQRAYNPNAKKMALLLQENLKLIGVKATLVSLDWSVFYNRLAKGEHDTVLSGWNADNTDPDNFFRPILSCQAKLAGTNRAMWCDPTYDNLIDLARQAPDKKTRTKYYWQAQDYLNEQMPLVPLAHGMLMQATRNHVNNIHIDPFGGIDFFSVTVE